MTQVFKSNLLIIIGCCVALSGIGIYYTNLKSQPRATVLVKNPQQLAYFTSPTPQGKTKDSLLRAGYIASIIDLKKSPSDKVKVGPLKIEATELQKCVQKCSIYARDLYQRSIQLIFFKSAFFNPLNKKTNKFYISGRLNRNKTSIYLTDVD